MHWKLKWKGAIRVDNISAFLGLIKKAGKLEVGEEPVGAACRSKKASLVLLASDTAPNSVRRATHFAEAGDILILPAPLDKVQMGLAIGRPPCGMLAITDIGFAAAMAKKLYALNPDLDPALLECLERKSQKAMQRRKEKRAHERNLLRGKVFNRNLSSETKRKK